MKAKELKTITGSLIKVTSNNSRRTFTIRTGGVRFRTKKMDKDEFESAKSWTGDDWSQFLETDEYFVCR